MEKSKKTLILGASPNPERYSNKVTLQLAANNHEVIPVGIRKGIIGEHEILTDNPIIEDVDTLTLYLGPKNQPPYYDYILNKIHPKRIIFNPGTENEELVALAKERSIETEIACTLVLLSIGNY